MRSYCRVGPFGPWAQWPSVGEVRLLGPHKRTVPWRKAGRSLKGFGFVPEVTACALTVRFKVGKVKVSFIDRLGFVPESRWPAGRLVVPFKALGSFPKLLHALLL